MKRLSPIDWTRTRKRIEFIAVLVTLLTAVIYFKDRIAGNKHEIRGAWKFNFKVQKSSKNSFVGLVAGYKIYITQEGNIIRGKGEKCWINGVELPSEQHDPLTFEGIITDGLLNAQYELLGTKRKSYGEFSVNISNTEMTGTFQGSAADSKGDVLATREN